MARNNLPYMVLGSLGALTLGTGLGVGLGQYTTSGINPFYSSATERAYEPNVSLEPTPADIAAAVYDPAR